MAVSLRRLAVLVAVFLAVLAVCAPLASADKPKECEICVNLLNKVEAQVKVKRTQAKANKEKFDAQSAIETSVDQVCEEDAKTQAEKKVCYYLTPVKRKISQPMSNYMPADRICKKLKAESPELCQVREAVKIDKGNTDYTKLRVKDLKKILADRGVQCSGCLEKEEFVKRCLETEDLHTEL
ncbi:Mesencephalic astrocyte-derived neurotrophic factor-like [Hondaea fermentalgiana]|uniref:Mesencephalic astrocyte-derived neurotrophic factor homolog n=1 Tax=Hondaea fermentalgiana TaxID=2315210 RepID=A0A2R5GQ33_9STRA|nr:Mesencephalic astrocyte-derived neurotrophic factor-like [Hondaea fermentalgiana]|eukprot:GBG32977.1 Mesencephalic astrocyte-derived neurotrophic factor-like [Hondaea fermentalgiana]